MTANFDHCRSDWICGTCDKVTDLCDCAEPVNRDVCSMDLAVIKAQVKANRANGRDPYDGLTSAEIGRYHGALMFGDNDEAFPGQAEWSRIVD